MKDKAGLRGGVSSVLDTSKILATVGLGFGGIGVNHFWWGLVGGAIALVCVQEVWGRDLMGLQGKRISNPIETVVLVSLKTQSSS